MTSYQSFTNAGLNQMLNMQLPAVGTSAPVSSGGRTNLIGAALDFGQTLLQRHWQKKDYRRQRQDALADYGMQRQDYLDDLAAERAYNSPAAQVARLKAAGINPNTAFGNGNVANTSSPAQAMASPRAAQFGAAPDSSFASAFLQGSSHDLASSMAQVQSREIDAHIAESKARMLESLSRHKNIDAQTKGQMITNGWLDAMYSLEADERRAKTAKIIDDMETSYLGRLSSWFDLNYLKPVQVQEAQARISELFASARSIVQQADYFDTVKGYRRGVERYSAHAARRDYAHTDFMQRFDREIVRIEQEMKKIDPNFKSDRYHEAMREIKFWLDSHLGFWAGVDHIPAIEKKPSRIGFK